MQEVFVDNKTAFPKFTAAGLLIMVNQSFQSHFASFQEVHSPVFPFCSAELVGSKNAVPAIPVPHQLHVLSMPRFGGSHLLRNLHCSSKPAPAEHEQLFQLHFQVNHSTLLLKERVNHINLVGNNTSMGNPETSALVKIT